MKHLAWILTAVCMITACKKDKERLPDETYNPEILPANFTNSTDLTNPYLLFDPGKKYIYEGQTEDGHERVEVQRLQITKVILGITCIVVNDKTWLDGNLIEDTDDWYAQDNDGNVWYMGEDVDNYNSDGSLRDHAGSWEAGVDGAKPGIIMPANPQVGMSYRQEYYFNEAEDQAEVVELGVNASVPFGNFSNCLKTREWTELEPDVDENKFYAPGIGLVKTVNVTDNEEELLIEIQQ
ncbi:MAG TPA: hypothetical protein PK228_21805 [Saprospiraceae bacterium]|nr:hypothetical protein [Saprospiraceae bacterium]